VICITGSMITFCTNRRLSKCAVWACMAICLLLEGLAGVDKWLRLSGWCKVRQTEKQI
jgi:hypothetical protein